MGTSGRCATIALGLLTLGVTAQSAVAQQPYPQTLYWGSGLIDIPVAWVSPLTGDYTLAASSKRFRDDPNIRISYARETNSQLTFSMAAFGRLEAGIAWYTPNPEWGLFGKAVLVNEESFRGSQGMARWIIPSLAVGVRNVGPFDKIDRFGAGYDFLPPTEGDPNFRHVADSLHQNFNTGNSVFGVATKSISLRDLRSEWPGVDIGLSVGYGNGLFSDDGGLGDAYSSRSTGGLFGGVRVAFAATPNTTVSLMAEHNAWDLNVGAVVDWRGLRGGLYVTELGGDAPAPATSHAQTLFNYRKVAVSVGWQNNILALLRGDFLRDRVAQLEREREMLMAEMQQRQARVATLEREIQRYEAQNLLELEQRRAEASRQLEAERDALRRLEERLRRLEQQAPPPPR